jgi:hypothetical protein
VVRENVRAVETSFNPCSDTRDLLEVITGFAGRRRLSGITRSHGFVLLL